MSHHCCDDHSCSTENESCSSAGHQKCGCCGGCQSCGCQCQSNCCGHHSCHPESNLHLEKLLHLADEAWMELLKEKIKENIEQMDPKINELARLVSEANHARWKSKKDFHKNEQDFHKKVEDLMSRHSSESSQSQSSQQGQSGQIGQSGQSSQYTQ